MGSSVREYAILYVGGKRGGSSVGGTIGGGNALLNAGQHALDGVEHTAAADQTRLDATTDAHGLLPKLSGSALEFLNGVGAFARATDALGPIAIRYTFSTITTDADPGAGFLRLSNATQYLAVTIRADLSDADGADVTALLDLIGTAGGPNTVLGYVRLQKRDDPTKWLAATVSAIASPSGYRNITIANIAKSTNSPFANGDAIVLSFVPVLTNPATTSQDLLVAGAGGTLGRLGKGSGSQVLTVDPSTLLLSWATPSTGGTLTVEELDGTPTDSAVTKLVLPNGTLAIVGHVATYTPAAAPNASSVILSKSSVSIVSGGAWTVAFATEDWDPDGYHFTSSANLTGTVSKTAASTAIVGVGTSFLSELAVGQVISVPGTAAEMGVVAAIADNTHLTLYQPMANSASGQTARRANEALSIPVGKGGVPFLVTGGIKMPTAIANTLWFGYVVNGAWQTTGQHIVNQTDTDRQASFADQIVLADGDWLQVGGLFSQVTKTDLVVKFAVTRLR